MKEQLREKTQEVKKVEKAEELQVYNGKRHATAMIDVAGKPTTISGAITLVSNAMVVFPFRVRYERSSHKWRRWRRRQPAGRWRRNSWYFFGFLFFLGGGLDGLSTTVTMSFVVRWHGRSGARVCNVLTAENWSVCP